MKFNDWQLEPQPVFLDEEIDPDFNPNSELSRSRIIDDSDLDGPEAKRLKHDNILEDGGNQKAECAICLLPMELPVRFPCSHEFCFTCAKGLMRTTAKSCGICRTEIPLNFIKNPESFATETVQAPIRKNSWFYKSRSGWWVYAPRMQTEIENAFQSGKSTYECIFNGRNCVLDFKKSIQTFGENEFQKKVQKIKRGLSDSSHLGVAGLRYRVPS
ncbi:Hypothetical predicted protein [Cloeon dipterum]|uniref:E3 ubiquitin-protein ligase n=1 Tax=Cloeon dipterum TaxID=197152 RepID=A0A8S1E8U6_9INSE|nr:Hypothetical predicted protein [Cloeon dipterum]